MGQETPTAQSCIDLLRQIRDVSFATVDEKGAPQIRIIDIMLAEPGALIGFAGPRVIEQTIGEKLPEGFQSAEFQLEHGFLDAVVPRARMRSTLSPCRSSGWGGGASADDVVFARCSGVLGSSHGSARRGAVVDIVRAGRRRLRGAVRARRSRMAVDMP